MITYENQIDQINEIVLKILLKIDPSLVVDIMLHNDYGEIKLTALWIMGSLRRDALQDYTVHITSMLTDANTYPNMVMTAMNILCKIDPEIVIRFITGHDEAHFLLASYALNQIGEREVQLYAERFACMLDDEQYAPVHTALIQVLSKLKFNPTELAKYAEAFKRNLTNPDASVRQCATSALQGLESTTLTQYAKFVETNLDDESVGVRVAAVITLGKLESNVLATYADHIKKLLTDQNDGVKVRALETLGNLEYDKLTKYYEDILKLALEEPNPRIRKEATLTLEKIEMPRRRIEDMNRRIRQRTR